MENTITVNVKVDNLEKTLSEYSKSIVAYSKPTLYFNIPGKFVELSDEYSEIAEYSVENNEFHFKRINSYTYHLCFIIKSDVHYKRSYIEINKEYYEITLSDIMHGGVFDVIDSDTKNKIKCQFIREK